MTVFFGIDVAKEKLDCAVIVHDRQRPIGQKAFPNSPGRYRESGRLGDKDL
jgi:hypothetical protein